ncbi:MAG: peptidyl-tRNA hydrolase Pth2 [Candidatus Diapherotrites archaeon]
MNGIKQAIIVRKDLKMGAGKIAAQAAHASLAALEKTKNTEIVEKWKAEGMPKIVLKVASEKELLELFMKAKKELPCALIKDAGRTQVEPGTATCIAIGPAEESKINKYTGKLKLL